MKTLLTFWCVFLLASCGAYGQAPKVDQVKLQEQIRSLKKERNQIVDQLEKDVGESRNTANALYDQLGVAQKDVKQIGKERDGWKSTSTGFELRVAKQSATILKLSGTIAAMVLVAGVYLFLKFYMRLPI